MRYSILKNIVITLCISLSAVSAGLILYFILKYGIDVPYMDQWEYVMFFSHLQKGTLTFNELFALQCEYRQLFPNLIFIGMGWLTDWNVKYEMLIIFFLACFTFYNIYRLATYTFSGDIWIKWILLFLCSLFVFSPLQYENWLFGVQIQYLMPIACITSCMFVAYSPLKTVWKLVICIVLSVISSYSAVNGLLCWFIVFPVLLFSKNGGSNSFRTWSYITIWIAAAILSITFYFYDYQSPENFPSPFLFINEPFNAIKYFFAILGNPIRIIHLLEHIIKLGAVLFTGYICLILYILWHYKNKQLLENTIPWLMMGIYSVSTALMVMVGRLGFGVYQALTSRYTSYTLYLIVAVIFLMAIVILNVSKKYKFNFIVKTFIAFLIAYIIYIKMDTYPVAVNDLKNFHANVAHGKAALLFINYIPHEECNSKIYLVHFKELKERANILNKMGYLRPPLIETNIIQNIEHDDSEKTDYGIFEKLTKINDTLFTASGFAQKPLKNTPVDAILLTCQKNHSESILFSLYNADSLNWEKSFVTNQIPFDTSFINAWAFDTELAKAYKLKGSFLLVK